MVIADGRIAARPKAEGWSFSRRCPLFPVNDRTTDLQEPTLRAMSGIQGYVWVGENGRNFLLRGQGDG
jgi:hypothetical protein